MRRIIPAVLLIAAAAFLAARFFPRITMKQVSVITIPGGADLHVNGVLSGITPAVRLVPGDGVHIAVSRDGFLPVDTLLHAVPDTVMLYLTQGTLLVINTIPPGCTVNAGNFTGQSPCSLIAFSGNPIEVTVTGDMGISVTRTVNILSPGMRVLNISVPWQFTDSLTGMDMAVIPGELLPFAMGPMTVGRSEVTAGMFAEFMNEMDPGLHRDSSNLVGRTVLMDSILKCNWRGPVSFNGDTTAYAPLPGMEDHPMAGVTREGAIWFCAWLTEKSVTGLVFRLPDPDEWASLAAPGDGMAFNHSDASEVILTRNPLVDDGWARTAPSGAMGYSPWGLGHMQGNVWEWLSEPGTAAGGSWLSSPQDCASGSVINLEEDLGYPFTGFRVAATGRPADIYPANQIETEAVE